MLDLSIEEETVAECVRIPAREGELEGILAYASDRDPWARVLLVGPHPLLGGDMQNNVMIALEAMLVGTGAATLRFNYAGVGASDGPPQTDASRLDNFWQTSHVDDEPDRWNDLKAAAEFLESAVNTTTPLAVAGYSFGCSVIARWIENAGTADAIVCIAPTIGRHEYRGLADSAIHKLVLASRNDFATDSETLTAAVSQWHGRNRIEMADLDDHFFRGCEPWLADRIVPFFVEALKGPSHE